MGKTPKIKWDIIDWAYPFKAGAKNCDLCRSKKMHIVLGSTLEWGVVAQRLERKTLIHEVMGLNPSVVISSVHPKGWGSDLHLGHFHRADKHALVYIP